MKTAICVSGICRGNVAQNVQLLRDAFPDADLFFGSWKGQEKTLIENEITNFFVFDEPVMHYHPIKDISDSEIKSPKLKIKKYKKCNEKWYYEKTSHHTKQILIHDMMLQNIDVSYDMIIRSRFDTVVSTSVIFKEYIKKSYDDNMAIGFGMRPIRFKNFNVVRKIPKIYPDGKNELINQDWGWYLMDPLIFHPRSLWNHKRVSFLHENKKLKAAEWGWYQILSEPYKDTHICAYGGAQIEKYMS